MMKEVSYADFSARVHANASKKRIPLNTSLELTHRCNNNCVHCYCNLPAGDPSAKDEELSFEEIERLFDELKDLGCLWLLITGGEPLLRDDFPDIYLSAKRHGFIPTVFTNGILISDDIADLFEKYPPFCVEITMYGATAETYERISRVSGSYRQYWEGLHKLLKRKIKLKLKSTTLSINQHELIEMDRMAREFGCDFRFDPLLHQRIDDRNSSNPLRYRISSEDVVRLDMEFPERMRSFEEFCSYYLNSPLESEHLVTCSAGRSYLHIFPTGIVAPCSMLGKMGLSWRENTLQEIWENHFKTLINIKKDFFEECDACIYWNLCDACAGWGVIEYGSIRKKVTYLCDITKRRVETFPFLINKGVTWT